MADDKSAYLRAQPEKIPSELRFLAYWCNWRWPDKAPTPAIGHTPLSFAQAIAVDDEHLGFHFLAEHPYCMVDLDEDTPHARATLKAARECGAYVERSVRRKWHIYGVGRLDRSITPGQVPGVEVYSHGRFGIVTGVEGTGSVEVSIQHILDRLDRLRASDSPQERSGGSTWNPAMHEPLLARIDADSAYGVWFEVSAACYHMGCPFEVWLAWCRTGKQKFPGERALREKWPKLKTESHETVYGEGTLYHHAEVVRGEQYDESAWDDVPGEGMNGAAVFDRPSRALSWLVAGAAPEGVTLFGALPKMGKTWLLYQLMLDEVFMGREVFRRPMLALMLEDSTDRAGRRLRKVGELLGLDDSVARERLKHVEIHTEWPTGGRGMARIAGWLEAQEPGAVVFIDTMARLLGEGGDQRKAGAYRTEYAESASLHTMAKRYGACVVLTTHLRKMRDADPTLMISGTTGLTGGVDTVWVLHGNRQERKAQFSTTGRDVDDELDVQVMKTQDNPLWRVDTEAMNWPRSAQQRAVLEVLRLEGAAMSPTAVAEMLADDAVFEGLADVRAGVTVQLARLVQHGWAERVERGRYVAKEKEFYDEESWDS